MSVRNTILDNLTTALATIDGINKCSRDYEPFPLLGSTGYPALFVVDDGGEEPGNYCDSDKVQFTMVVTIVGYCQWEKNLSSQFSDFLEAVYDIIYAPVSLGDNARDCTVVSVNPIATGPDESSVIFHVNLQIKFWRILGGA